MGEAHLWESQTSRVSQHGIHCKEVAELLKTSLLLLEALSIILLPASFVWTCRNHCREIQTKPKQVKTRRKIKLGQQNLIFHTLLPLGKGDRTNSMQQILVTLSNMSWKQLRCCGDKNRMGMNSEHLNKLLQQTPNKIPTFMSLVVCGLSGASVRWEKSITAAYSKNLAVSSHQTGGAEGKGGGRAVNCHLCYFLTETETVPVCSRASANTAFEEATETWAQTCQRSEAEHQGGMNQDWWEMLL